MVSNFRAGRPGGDEESPHRVRDRDQPPGARGERPVHVPERAELVAVVVVARRDVRDARQSRCDRAVDVAVHQMRVEQIGTKSAEDADDVPSHPRAHVARAAHVLDGNSCLGQPRVHPRRVAALDVEPDEACVDAPCSQRRQQPEQVLLGACDAGDLEEVHDPHRASRLRYRRSTSSTIRSFE